MKIRECREVEMLPSLPQISAPLANHNSEREIEEATAGDDAQPSFGGDLRLDWFDQESI